VEDRNFDRQSETFQLWIFGKWLFSLVEILDFGRRWLFQSEKPFGWWLSGPMLHHCAAIREKDIAVLKKGIILSSTAGNLAVALSNTRF
jgi:hypothetical protein